MLLGDLVAVHEDAVDLAGRVQQRLVHEVQDGLRRRTAGFAVQRRLRTAGHVGLPGAVHAIQQFDVALGNDFGQRVAHRAADDAPVTDELEVAGVHDLEHVVGSAHDREEARGLLEQGLQPLLLQAVALFGHDRRGGLRTGAVEAGLRPCSSSTGE